MGDRRDRDRGHHGHPYQGQHALFTASTSDLDGTRALNTVYQNSSGKSVFASVDVSHAGSAVQLTISALCENANPPTEQAAYQELDTCPATTAYLWVGFLVPNGWRYKVTSTNGTLQHWKETGLY